MVEADFVFSSTSSPQPILCKEAMEDVMSRRPQRNLSLVDIAMPRDIDPLCKQVPNVSLYDIDDLQKIIDANYIDRCYSRDQALRLIETDVQVFHRWLNSFMIHPVLKSFDQYLVKVLERELLKSLGEQDQSAKSRQRKVEMISRSIRKKILSDIVKVFRQSRGNLDNQKLSKALVNICNLHTEEVPLEYITKEVRSHFVN